MIEMIGTIVSLILLTAGPVYMGWAGIREIEGRSSKKQVIAGVCLLAVAVALIWIISSVYV